MGIRQAFFMKFFHFFRQILKVNQPASRGAHAIAGSNAGIARGDYHGHCAERSDEAIFPVCTSWFETILAVFTAAAVIDADSLLILCWSVELGPDFTSLYHACPGQHAWASVPSHVRFLNSE